MPEETEEAYIDRTVKQVRYLWTYMDLRDRLDFASHMAPLLGFDSVLECAAFLGRPEE